MIVAAEAGGRRVRAFGRLWLGRLAQGCDAAGLAVQMREKDAPVVLRVRVPFLDGTLSTVGESVMVRPGPGSMRDHPVWWFVGAEPLAPCEQEGRAVDIWAARLTPVVVSQVLVVGTAVWWSAQTRRWWALVPGPDGPDFFGKATVGELLADLSEPQMPRVPGRARPGRGW